MSACEKSACFTTRKRIMRSALGIESSPIKEKGSIRMRECECI